MKPMVSTNENNLKLLVSLSKQLLKLFSCLHASDFIPFENMRYFNSAKRRFFLKKCLSLARKQKQ